MQLTDLQVRRIKPTKKRFEVLDHDGLYLRVMPSGSKSFIFRYLFDGRPRRFTLGVYHPSPADGNPEYHTAGAVGKLPFLSLSEAREDHAEARAKLSRGIDPGTERKAARSARKESPTFEDFLKEFDEKELQEKKSGPETLRLLQKDILPAWGKRKVADIKRRDIVLLLDGIRERAPITANRVHGALTRGFNFAAERGIIEDSPCTRIRKAEEEPRTRVLSDEEIKLLWAALALSNKAIDVWHITKLALKMILITGQRPGEVCGATWGEVEGSFWNIPAERTKGAAAHFVPLSGLALEIIETARPYSKGKDFVFPSAFEKGRITPCPITPRALSRAIDRHWQQIGAAEKFTPHDLRRTVRTKLAEIGIDDIVAERVLGHKLQGMAKIYNQHPYQVEKRRALEAWEERLKEIVGLAEQPANVIPMRRGRHEQK